MDRSTAGMAITALVIGLTVLLGSCMDAALSQSGSAQAQVAIQQVPASVDEVSVSVSGPGMADIEKTVSRGTNGLILEIPVGPERVFEAEAGGYSSRSVLGVPADGVQVSLELSADETLLFAGGWDGDPEVYEASAVEGAVPRQLTDNTSADLEPLYTPDGSRVVFRSDRGQSSGDFHLYSMNTDGTGVTQLSDELVEDNASVRTWSISPDGSTVAFFAAANAFPSNWNIYTVSASGGTPTLVKTDATPGGAPDPLRWSPDGTRILYVGYNETTLDDEVRTIGPSGGSEKVLAAESFIQFADWLSGSDRIVYSYAATSDIIESITTNPSAPDPIELDNRTDLSAKGLSNDRETLAYLVDDGTKNDLYTVATDGSGNPTPVTTDVDTFYGSFAWGQDGDRIAISKNSRATVGYVAADGSGGYQTIETGSDFTVGQWSSETGTLAFVENIPIGVESSYDVLWTADVSGSEAAVTEILGQQQPGSYSIDLVNWRPPLGGSSS